MKELELIVKKVESGKKKFNTYTYRDQNNGKWYKIKFVKGCVEPLTLMIEENINRSFIGLDIKNDFNITTEDRQYEGNVIHDNIIYICNYTNLSKDRVDELLKMSIKNIENFRNEAKQNKINFIESKD